MRKERRGGRKGRDIRSERGQGMEWGRVSVREDEVGVREEE